MNLGFLLRLFLCLLVFSVYLFLYVEKQNELTELRFRIPVVAKELKALQDENAKLQYEVEQFENPAHLMELARNPEFTHLKHPLVKDIIVLDAPGEGP